MSIDRGRPAARARPRLPGCALLVLLLAGVQGLAHAQQPSAAAARETTVYGRITNEAGTPLAAALVVALDGAGERTVRSLISDASGAYRLVGLAPGDYQLRASFVGHETTVRTVSLVAGQPLRVDLMLRVVAVEIEAVEVQARRDIDRERARFETEAGVTARVVGGQELRILPGLAEADVLRAVELLPGVVSTTDFSSAFNVRGGSADQNLILLDGFPIFNPFHLGGLFSVFNPDMVARAELLAGGFGAEYGGRVSSVLNVESQVETDGPGLRVDGGVSLLASRFTLRSSVPPVIARGLGGEGGSWALSARRSYFDQILRPAVDFPYHLTDVQTHAWVGTAGGGRLRVTGYTGQDVLDLTDFTPPGGDAASVLRVLWRWGNDVLGVHWQQPVGGTWIADTRVGYSRYRDGLRLADFDDTEFSSRISQLSLRSDLARDFATVSVRGGVEGSRLAYENRAEAGGAVFDEAADDGMLGSAYVSTRWRLRDTWLVEGGLRSDVWWAQDTSYTELSPRLAVKRFFGAERDAAVKSSVGRYVQFLHSLRNEEFPLSNDRWIVANRSTPRVVSDQVQVGIEKFWGDTWFASVEAYARNFEGITEFNAADDPNDPTDDVLVGRGRSRGLDVLVRRTAGRLVGWTAVSLLRAERTFPDPLASGISELPPEITFAPFWDRRVNINLVLQYELPRAVEAGVRWNYGSPLPYTRPVAQHFVWEYGLDQGRYRIPQRDAGDDDGEARPPLFVVPGTRNAERYPAYHRLDITFRRTYRPHWGTLTPYLQVLNVYNRRNVLFYFYNYDRTPPTRSGISMFPVLPALGVEVSF
jgi:hypothetical protein